MELKLDRVFHVSDMDANGTDDTVLFYPIRGCCLTATQFAAALPVRESWQEQRSTAPHINDCCQLTVTYTALEARIFFD
jgi:hypothetical protein